MSAGALMRAYADLWGFVYRPSELTYLQFLDTQPHDLARRLREAP